MCFQLLRYVDDGCSEFWQAYFRCHNGTCCHRTVAVFAEVFFSPSVTSVLRVIHYFEQNLPRLLEAPFSSFLLEGLDR